MHAYIHAHIHGTHIQTYMHTCTYINACMRAHILAIQHICIDSSMYTCNALRYIAMQYISSPYVALRFTSHCIHTSYCMQRMARQDKAMGKGRGKTRTSKARQGEARHCKAGQDKTRPDKKDREGHDKSHKNRQESHKTKQGRARPDKTRQATHVGQVRQGQMTV